MLAAERQQKILSRIKKDGRVTVETLAKEYDVSLMTIRRDLELLNEKGCLERCHGGAVAKKEVPYFEKINSNEAEKNAIATKALEFIHNGDCIFLDAGTTNLCLAKKLHSFHDLTVVTNDLEIGYFVNRYQFNLIICGGEVQKQTSCMLGNFMNEMIMNIKFDISFLGAASIDSEFEVLTPTEDKVIYKRNVVRNSSLSFLLVDSSKFNQKAMRKINGLNDYSGIITTYDFNPNEWDKIIEEKINIIKA